MRLLSGAAMGKIRPTTSTLTQSCDGMEIAWALNARLAFIGDRLSQWLAGKRRSLLRSRLLECDPSKGQSPASSAVNQLTYLLLPFGMPRFSSGKKLVLKIDDFGNYFGISVAAALRVAGLPAHAIAVSSSSYPKLFTSA